MHHSPPWFQILMHTPLLTTSTIYIPLSYPIRAGTQSMMLSRVCAVALLLLWCNTCKAAAHVVLPPKLDGFVYGGGALQEEDAVVVEAFFDPVCPDSRDSWPPLKRIIAAYPPSRISLRVHPFPLPFHVNSFIASRALHIANQLDSSKTYHLLEMFFKFQEKFYNTRTLDMTRESITEEMANLTSNALGDGALFPAVLAALQDHSSDVAARISFRYGCSRGVSGTPYFFVNGFLLPGGGSPLPYKTWKTLLDPLLKMGKQIQGYEKELIN